MKTSTKLIISALVILIISIGFYNSKLKAELTNSNYKNPYRNYNSLTLKDFNEVEINGASIVEAEFKQGDYAVYYSKNNRDSVYFTKVGNRLIVKVDIKEMPKPDTNYDTRIIDPLNQHRANRIVIVCPSLSWLKTDNALLVNGKPAQDYKVSIAPTVGDKSTAVKDYSVIGNNFYNYLANIDLTALKLDSLHIIENGSNLISFQNCKIEKLKVASGPFSSLHLGKSNVIKNADLQISAGSEMVLSNIFFPKLTYHVSDSARVSLSGISLKSFIKQ